MPYPALAVANYFIRRGVVEGRPVDHLTVQKLAYIAHGWHLAIQGSALIRNRVEAWKYGPVIPDIYHELKGHGNSPITTLVHEFRGLELTVPMVESGDRQTIDLLARVWEVYRDFSGVQLSNLTHEEGTPWDETWRKRQGGRIPNDLIKKHFHELGQRGRED